MMVGIRFYLAIEARMQGAVMVVNDECRLIPLELRAPFPGS
jgi:hypothetical protein